MIGTIEIPVWLFLLILAFAVVTFASHFLFPSVRWFLRRRMERVVARINQRLERPIEPFKLARRVDMIQRLIYDPQVSEAVVAYAQANGVREDVAFEKARRYAREIVPSFSATAYFGVAIRLARWLSRSLYHVRLTNQDDAAIRAINPEATVVYVINHRSNMDYVLVTYLAAERSALAYAVGEWARVWPLSFLIRSMGAYFIRRKSRDDLYRRVLARYVALATAGGLAQGMFPEGGLSLTGAPAVPRVGLLKYIVDGWDPAGRDVVFVPVALNYDRVLEDRVLIAAGKSGERRFRGRLGEALIFLLRHIRLRVMGKFHRFGCAAVSFGMPLDLRGFVEIQGRRPEALAQELMTRIGAAVPILPVPLVAYCLRDGTARTRAEIEALAEAFPGVCPEKDADAGASAGPAEVAAGIEGLLRRELIAETAGRYAILPHQAEVVAFYANSIAHLARSDAAQAR
ncbi:1-acyl-sn-glycerol-3-phosphate acyltransferase [Marinovum sp. 2_MG-2023]|uniref:1-acyl-sn-glycerol-3-phosphate acyltransferase n=1 Tax=Roseobacteraceae TaxID=2854170 RepID=UPI001FD2750E|nr:MULTISPECIES: 1-acyl-sn-glycerol-3-phosphate acyltransferase [Roseobacteraceae]MCJ7871723.1 1-acyl-sn-glycerol-3-phosphate acyltransferase [Phaeobacter sp. J2-8]MDO6728557.1 1-acyl-sn-glycerol-3-phosphate acyltransferase [Marinovum sp. 2_MG-2023]MDO6778027.1 1-acyl-sn-glycerol-3-phosphate acyltransferase [Marinovum sp. 1_MG-2023]